MSQHPLRNSGFPSSETSRLQPALAAALASLEVQLDQELARYRRTRIASKKPTPSRVESYVSTPDPDLTSMTTTEETPPFEAATPTHLTPASVPEIPQPESEPDIEKLDNLTLSSEPESIKTQIPLPSQNSASIVPAVTVNTDSEDILPPDQAPPQPDDYLESSEALLRSLTDEEPQTRKPSNSSSGLLSPLGLGSMLLLLVATLTLGYLVLNPNTLAQLNFSRLLNGNSPSGNNAEGVGNNTATQAQPELTPIPKYPNLAVKEFPEVKDPNDVVGLQPKAQATPTVAPTPIVAQTPITPPVVSQLPQVQPSPPVNVTPSPTLAPVPPPTTTPPQTNTEIKPPADGYYHIVMDNQGDRTLAAVRQIIPDAYLSSNKKLIYLGALKTKEQGEKLLQELQARGISARFQQQ